jgi:hypothetical protein
MGCHAWESFEKEILDDLLGIVPGHGGLIGDALQGVDEFFFHGGFEDFIGDSWDWVEKEVFRPIGDFVEGVMKGMAEDPLYTTAMIVVSFYYPEAIPYLVALKSKADGASWGEAIEAGAKAYVAQGVTQKFLDLDILASVQGGIEATLTQAGIDPNTIEAFVEASSKVVTAGLEQGTISIVSGDSFSDGFNIGATFSIAAQATDVVMNFLDEKTDGMQFKQNKTKDVGGIQRAVDDQNRLVFESDANGFDDFTKKLPNTGEVKQVYKTIPDVIQNVVASAVSARLQGKEITDYVLASAAAESLITTTLVGDLMNKIDGVDLNSKDGQLFLSYLTPAIQDTVAQIATMGLTEETGTMTFKNVMGAAEKYGNSQLFLKTIDLLEDTELVINAYQKIDQLTGFIDDVKSKTEAYQVAYAEYADKVAIYNPLVEEGNVLLADAEAAQKDLQSTYSGNFLLDAANQMEASIERTVDPVTGKETTTSIGFPSDTFANLEEFYNFKVSALGGTYTADDGAEK